MVEVLRLDAGPKTVLVQLNWDLGPDRCVTVRIPGGAGFKTVASSEPAPVTAAPDGDDLELQLTLGRVAALELQP